MNGFWSLTMYDAEYFFVANPLESLHDQRARASLKTNADGSVDLYIQNESPGKDKEANWLPAPKDKFILMMRLYWPTENAAVDHRRHLEDPAGDDRSLSVWRVGQWRSKRSAIAGSLDSKAPSLYIKRPLTKVARMRDRNTKPANGVQPHFE